MNAVAEVIVAIAFFLLIGSICADILIGTVAHIREMAAIKERSREWAVLFAAARNAKREYERKSAALEPTGWNWRGPDDSPPAGSQCVVVLEGGRPTVADYDGERFVATVRTQQHDAGEPVRGIEKWALAEVT